MFVSKTAVVLGAAAVWVAALASIYESKTLGVCVGILGVVAWFFQHRAAQQAEAEANARAEKTAKELFELSRRVEPRRIDGERREALLAALRGAATKGPITVHVPSGDAEPLLYAEQLIAVLAASGWPWEGIYVASDDHFVAEPYALTLSVTNPAAPPPHCIALRNALTQAGIETALVRNKNPAFKDVNLFVDPKPPL